MKMNKNRSRLFFASCFALLVTSMTFAIRAKIEGVFSAPLADGGYGLSNEEVGWAFGPAFWGFTLAMFAGGLIIDIVKTKTIVWMAFITHLIGFALLLTARDKNMLFISNVLIGLGNGSVEAACNPLIATLYPKEKTKMLNRFHVWFPGGIVIGGLLATVVMDSMNMSWLVLTALLFIPLIVYGFLFFGQVIPETERVTSGVTYKDMLKNVGAPFTVIALVGFMILVASSQFITLDFSTTLPYIGLGAVAVLILVEGLVVNKTSLLFPFLLFCMFLTATTELGTTQWMNSLLENNGVNPIIILVVITGVMAVGRFFAGPLVHSLNPIGVLLGSAIIAAFGLYALSIASGTALTLGAAVIFAIGVCYFWPTMLGVVAEYTPKTGALGLSIMGGAGMVATALILPIMGRSIDNLGAQMTLKNMSILPVILIVLFTVIVFYSRKKQPVQEKRQQVEVA